MLQSFVVLARTQNLSTTVETLDVSRQTIRRHVAELEQRAGEPLFDTTNRQYRLTDRGQKLMGDAEMLLERSVACINNTIASPFDLLGTEIFIDEVSWLYAQQHSLIDVWSAAPPIIQRGFEAWNQAKGRLDSPAFDQIRPYILVYRRYREEWLIVEVGDQSAYCTWLGKSTAKSELGRGLDLGEKFQPLVEYWRKPYNAVLGTGGAWYEHISVSVPRKLGGEPVPVNYQRLLVACKFPDDQPAIVVFAARTDKCDIPAMPSSLRVKNLPENLMEFEI